LGTDNEKALYQGLWFVELMGFEPMTSCLPSTRSTN
jgi:hypothetical protein